MQTNFGYQKIRPVRSRLSKHASARSAQRAVDPAALPLIASFGDRDFDGWGGVRYSLTPRAHRKLVNVVGDTPQVQALAGCYVVLDAKTQTTVITIGHRH